MIAGSFPSLYSSVVSHSHFSHVCFPTLSHTFSNLILKTKKKRKGGTDRVYGRRWDRVTVVIEINRIGMLKDKRCLKEFYDRRGRLVLLTVWKKNQKQTRQEKENGQQLEGEVEAAPCSSCPPTYSVTTLLRKNRWNSVVAAAGEASSFQYVKLDTLFMEGKDCSWKLISWSKYRPLNAPNVPACLLRTKKTTTLTAGCQAAARRWGVLKPVWRTCVHFWALTGENTGTVTTRCVWLPPVSISLRARCDGKPGTCKRTHDR